MPNINDLADQKVGKLTVIAFSGIIEHRAIWICRCECGNYKEIRSDMIRGKKVGSCGCMQMQERDDLIGQNFGKLTVFERAGLKLVGANQRPRRMWLCKCECGENSYVTTNDLKSGHTKSCGCLNGPGSNNFHWTGYKEISGAFWNRRKFNAKKEILVSKSQSNRLMTSL